MNANELAVYLEDITDWEESPYRQAATMLRQQQGAIENLKTFYEDRIEAGKKREETMMKTIESLLRKAQEK